MKDEGTIIVYNFNHSKDRVKLKLNVNNFLTENRTLQVYVNSVLKQSILVVNGDNDIEMIPIDNTIKFKIIDNDIEMILSTYTGEIYLKMIELYNKGHIL